METFNLYFSVFCQSILIFMGCYFIIQFIILRKKEYFYYSIYLFLLFAYNLIALPEIFWGINPYNENLIYKFDLFKRPIQYTSSVFYSLFVIHYLNLNESSFKLYKFLKLVILVYAIAAIISLLLNYAEIPYDAVYYIFGFLFFPLQLYIVIILLKTQIRYARYIVWGSILLIIGSILSLLLSIFNRSPELHIWLAGMSPFVPIQFCVLIDLLLYTIALQRKVADNEKHLIKLAFARQQATHLERERIVADLHDDVGGGLSSIRMISDLMLQESQKQNNPTIVSFAEKISAATKEIAQRMNTIIWSLNVKNDTLKNFVEYVREYGLNYFDLSNVKFSCTLPDLISANIILSGEQRKNLFLILKESFHNTLKHAQANTCKLSIELKHSQILVEVCDDGLGSKTALDEKSMGSGNGIRNMQKRMNEIKGQLNISFTDDGTCLSLSLPIKV